MLFGGELCSILLTTAVSVEWLVKKPSGGWFHNDECWRNTVPFQSIRQAMLHVTCLPKFWIWHMGEMTVTNIFFQQIFTIFFAIFKAFFTTSFYGFGTWPKWPLQPLPFGVFGAAVTCYCRIDRNGTVPCRSFANEENKLIRRLKNYIIIALFRSRGRGGG